MNISCQNIINLERPMQGIMDLKRAGFERILLNINANFPKLDLLKEKNAPKVIGEGYEWFIGKCRENTIHISAVSVPNIPYKTAMEKNYADFLRKCALECIRLCSKAGCGYVVIPSLLAERGKTWEVNREFYLMLAETAKEHSVHILLKNQYEEIGGRLVRGNCAEPFQAAEWIDRLNSESGGERFGFCLDTGICSLCGNDIHKFIMELGERIKTVVLKGCTGQKETSMLPFMCADSGTDWLGIIRGLRDIHFDGELIIDFSDTMRAFSPLLRPTLYKLAKETANYFKWQTELEQNMRKYKKLVLFGAGNMCRNYMKNYGEKYPPLFTCDNNSRLWGTEFCGLKVKSPEALKELPEDCGIFICNIYYREIEEQLQKMGIRENIEYFNDEYLTVL